MSWSVSLFLPLAAMALGGAPATPHEGGSERFARVLVTSYVCETLGFGVNYEGLADWGRAVQAEMVADGATPEAALAHIRRDVRDARDRFHSLHGQALVTAGASVSGFAGVAEGYDAQYRFQKSFTDRCKDLAAAPDTGALFTVPEQRLSGAEFSHTMTALYRGRTGGR
jgi:hypothetical protein